MSKLKRTKQGKFNIEDSNTSIGSFNFKMHVEPDPYDGTNGGNL